MASSEANPNNGVAIILHTNLFDGVKIYRDKKLEMVTF